ncbi:neuropeptide CCHamide-1 isoform X1 [Nymphalis io]|uniref:neuropeptide CCHamide-1 isoform X1 n=1 Tax=Inachis io TaxID=171585 RepID=UPI002169C1EB|nr:neuropeptide CCHamide-1 isoform X1 [Nymphalis io]
MIGKGVSKSSATVRAILVLFLIVCLVNCATEQRINSRGSKASNLIQKVNGWRSQRGGSCLSYGHSCWGAHGKRSGKAPASAPDWYITRILRRMAASNEMNRAQNLAGPNEIDVYRVEDDVPSSNKFMTESEEVPVVVAARGAEAKPMLDDDMLSRLKIWQIIRAAAEEK